MFKLLMKLISLLVLLLISMTLFTWSVGQLYPTQNQQVTEKNLIANAQAEANAVIPVYQPIIPHNNHTTLIQQPNLKEIAVAKKHVEFQFNELETKLTVDEQSHLSEILHQLNIMPTHIVTVFAGPAPAENTILSLPLAKLRVQAIARVVYPYTQTIKMAYRPNLPPGLVMIEVSQVMKNNVR